MGLVLYNRVYKKWTDISTLNIRDYLGIGALLLFLQNFQHYWWLLVTASAIPIILLRSDSSVDLGLGMLKNHWYRKGSVPRFDKICMLALAATVSFAISYWMHEYKLPYDNAWAWFWRSIVISFVATFIAINIAEGSSVREDGVGNTTVFGAVNGSWIGIFLGMALVCFENASFAESAATFAGALVGIITTTIYSSLISTSTVGHLISFTFFLFGTWLRILMIRVIATLSFPWLGIKNIPLNWHRVNWCLDFTHHAEFLPSAGTVNYTFSTKGILDTLKNNRSADLTAIATRLLFLPFLYIPAMLWRWSIKATIWLWWPLSLVLKHPFKTENMYQIRKAIVTIVSGWWKWLLFPIVVLIPWLLSGCFPQVGELVNLLLPEKQNMLFATLLTYGVPDPFSLRYAAISLVCVMSTIVWWKANGMKNQFPMVIGDETYVTQIENDSQFWQQKKGFYKQAESIARWHTWRIVSLILLGYSYILYLVNTLYPEQAKLFLADWFILFL